jgi:4-carboxymuconolactone decarboxylase
VEGYGKVLGRPGLELATRELCILALLVVLGAPRQLYSHIRGAQNAGASSQEIQEALDLACTLIGPEGAREARAVWDQVRGRARSATSPEAPSTSVAQRPATEG